LGLLSTAVESQVQAMGQTAFTSLHLRKINKKTQNIWFVESLEKLF